jgi:hypothetical protein
MDSYQFDLQLFADDGAAAGGAPDAGADNANNGDAGAENQTAGTILGSAGQQPPANPAEGQQEGAQGAEVPQAYDFTNVVPEGMEYDAQTAQAFGNVARECGLTQDQASKVAAYGMQYMQEGVKAAMQQITATHIQWGEDAKAQLGADFDKTVAKAAVGIDRVSQQIPGLREMFNETGVGNRVEMIRFMAAVGELVGEDNGHGVPGYGGEKSLYPNTNFDRYK